MGSEARPGQEEMEDHVAKGLGNGGKPALHYPSMLQAPPTILGP